MVPCPWLGYDSIPMTSTESRDALDFRALQERLPLLWTTIQADNSLPVCSVVIPSLSMDPNELRKVEGVTYYEERLLFSLIRLRNPNARVLYVSSLPIHPDIVEYYLHLLIGVPASHARARLGLFSVHDGSPLPLTKKILDRPRAIERMRRWVGDRRLAYLTCFCSTALERELAVRLGIPLNGVDPDLIEWGTKTGSREAFTEAGVPHPAGFNDLRSEEEVVDSLERLTRERPHMRNAIIKLNESFSGEGNAVITLPEPLPKEPPALRDALTEGLRACRFAAPDETYARYMGKFGEAGGIVEERIVAQEVRSPSVQMRITPDMELHVVSTHEQVLGGSTGQVFIGCKFPAEEAYRLWITEEALKVGRVLRDKGVISRFSVDFLMARSGDEPWQGYAIEINLRMGGTTHPFLALEFLTGGTLSLGDGQFHTPRGDLKSYFATDNLKSPSYKGLLPEDLLDILVQRGLQFRPNTETGVLFHMIGSLSQYGKLGVTCIGNSPEEAETLYERTVAVLDEETGAEIGGHSEGLLDSRIPRME